MIIETTHTLVRLLVSGLLVAAIGCSSDPNRDASDDDAAVVDGDLGLDIAGTDTAQDLALDSTVDSQDLDAATNEVGDGATDSQPDRQPDDGSDTVEEDDLDAFDAGLDPTDDGAGFPTTTIRVHYDTGFGNSIAIRGDGAGLSWDENSASIWGEGNVWTYTTTAWDAAVEFKPVFIRESGEVVWPAGTNWEVQPGATLDIRPFFFATEGTLVTLTVESTILGVSRPVEVYLPPSYNELGALFVGYPVVVMLDGQNLFDEGAIGGGWRLGTSLGPLQVGATIADGETFIEVGSTAQFIVVAPHHGGSDRLREYTPWPTISAEVCGDQDQCGGDGDDTLDFIIDEVMPQIRAEYRVRTGPLTIVGSSLGGLMSLYACWTRPSDFDRCGALSPSLWWNGGTMAQQIVSTPMAELPGATIYLDAGTVSDGLPLLEALNAVLVGFGWQAGRDLLCRQGQDQGHNEAAWRARAPFALHFLTADPDRVQPEFGWPADNLACP